MVRTKILHDSIAKMFRYNNIAWAKNGVFVIHSGISCFHFGPSFCGRPDLIRARAALLVESVISDCHNPVSWLIAQFPNDHFGAAEFIPLCVTKSAPRGLHRPQTGSRRSAGTARRSPCTKYAVGFRLRRSHLEQRAALSWP